MYLFWFNSIDATTEPSSGPRLGRLVNHGDREEDRNCVMKVIGAANRPFLCLFAKRSIVFGEQLLYDYGVPVPWVCIFVVIIAIKFISGVFYLL